MTEWITVCKVDELLPGNSKTISVEDQEIAVFNLEGQFYAIENKCSHDGGSLAGGWMEDDAIVCPRHGAQFCIKTGEVLAPPAYEDIATFLTRISDQCVQVSVTGSNSE